MTDLPDGPDAAVRCLASFLDERDDGLAIEPRALRRWLDDSLRLAGHEPGRRAAEMTDAPLLSAVYRDLESIERARRAELLRGLARVLCRRVPSSLGSSALDLIAPLSLGAPEALRAGFRREITRNVSTRLFDGPLPERADFSALGRADAASAPVSIVRALAALAAGLEGGFEGRLASAETRLACEGGEAVASDLAALSRMLDEASDPVVATDVIARLRVAAAFATDDDETVLDVLVAGALSLDRSASAGTMRAAARHRRRDGRPRAAGMRASARDEFRGTVDAHERRRIARFLAEAAGRSRREEVEAS